MLRSLHTAALGMSTQQAGVDNTANNLANANTTGFKRSTIVFQDLLYQNIQTPAIGAAQGGAPPANLQMGHGATAVATVRNFTQGGFTETGNSFDIAINGDGFLQVSTPDGEIQYTRDGTLTLSPEGSIITQMGLPVEPDISVPQEASELIITQDGLVRARIQGQSDMVDLGQLELARFPNSAGLDSVGNNLYTQTEASGEPTIGAPGQEGMGSIRQGFLEGSNVDVVQEMVALIAAQRAYEINSKVVTTSEEMMQMSNSMKR
ncbi:MAG: flagellar basal-body rod protein FlgG [Bacteroidota bacterium]